MSAFHTQHRNFGAHNETDVGNETCLSANKCKIIVAALLTSEIEVTVQARAPASLSLGK
jgi:hypothetical protein